MAFMFIYAHDPYIVKGYGALTHEAIVMEKEGIYEVLENVGQWLVGTYPGSFCAVSSKNTYHSCPRAPRIFEDAQTYATTEMDSPPEHRMLRARGRPKKVRG